MTGWPAVSSIGTASDRSGSRPRVRARRGRTPSILAVTAYVAMIGAAYATTEPTAILRR